MLKEREIEWNYIFIIWEDRNKLLLPAYTYTVNTDEPDKVRVG